MPEPIDSEPTLFGRIFRSPWRVRETKPRAMHLKIRSEHSRIRGIGHCGTKVLQQTSLMMNWFATTEIWSSGTRCAAHMALVVVSSGMMWKTQVSLGSVTVRPSPACQNSVKRNTLPVRSTTWGRVQPSKLSSLYPTPFSKWNNR